jgi:hypothetical protein
LLLLLPKLHCWRCRCWVVAASSAAVAGQSALLLI